MKVNKLIALQSIIEERKIPYDMEKDHLYYSESKEEFINIMDMDIIHLVRAFTKTLNELQLERERPPEYDNLASRYIRKWQQGNKR